MADDQNRPTFTSKSAVDLKTFPSEYAQRHVKVAWWDHMMVRIANVPGLTEVAYNHEPSVVKSIVLVPLDEIPELDPTAV